VRRRLPVWCGCLAARHARDRRAPTPIQEAGLTPDVRPPGWLDALVRSAAFAVVALGLVGLPLALLGQFRRLPVAVGTVLVFAALHLLWLRWQRGG
jgi:hypothetical protein